ncbi:acyl carrier protein [Bradyrhizobium sp. USDA 4486]
MTLALPLEPLKKQIRAFLTANFYISDVAALKDDASLLDQGIIDSTGVLEVVGFIETTFGIAVDDSEILPENLDTIQGMAHYIDGKIKSTVDT